MQDYRIVIGQEVERRSKVLAELRVFRDRVGKDGPAPMCYKQESQHAFKQKERESVIHHSTYHALNNPATTVAKRISPNNHIGW